MTTTNPAAPRTVTTPHEREIRVERVFDADRDRVWAAYTDPELLARWWGRGNRLDVERFEFERGGHWRFVEHSDGEAHGFEGRFREITPKDRIVQSFEWDGMPAYVAIDTATFEDLGDGRTRVVTVSQFHTSEERDGMLNSGMAEGLGQSYAALDALLART
ncbi:MAG: SRPBCC family protein [Rhodococcus ruber]|nr:SRPBCC family protein [Rhodococcus ruber]